MTADAPIDPVRAVRERVQAALVKKAEDDADFRALLVSDPRAALTSLLGTNPVPHLKLSVIEEKPGEVVIVLPAPIEVDELPDDVLDLASGGTSFSAFILYGPDDVVRK
ncbi:NHLP leader peptide family natural product precursor [Novispirillum sp. DQ9]|uniref:NHLP leader peptide family natural product precursor n=1 Tax=Novispirillum sp. DQ9 TaxID=3398612 RepID=UPI003C7A054A